MGEEATLMEGETQDITGIQQSERFDFGSIILSVQPLCCQQTTETE